MKKTGIIRIAAAAAIALTAGGCFTGVEGTKRISDADVRRDAQRLPPPTEEKEFLASITPQPPSRWAKGKEWLVTDEKIRIIFSPPAESADSLTGRRLRFERFEPAVSVTGEEETLVVFSTDGAKGDTLLYHAGMPFDKISGAERLDIPFAIDLDLVARADSMARGTAAFVITPSWYAVDSRKAIDGYRHVAVVIDSVSAGNAVYPLAVHFHTTDPTLRGLPGAEGEKLLFMTIGNGRSATRNFETLFSFTDPRKKYPATTDEVWRHIIRSRLCDGMTRDECRLALGAPTAIERIPTRAGMVERWSYSDGVYLIFDDNGLLSRFRQ